MAPRIWGSCDSEKAVYSFVAVGQVVIQEISTILTTLNQMEQKLRSAFSPAELTLRDDSEQHRGHVGFREGETTHVHVRMRAAQLDGLTRVAQQRAVMKALAEELEGPVHALSMDIAGTAP